MARTEKQQGIAQQVHDVLGFKLTAVCYDRGGYDKPSKWKVVIHFNGTTVESDYTMGAGLRTWVLGLRPYQTANSMWHKYYKSGKRVPYIGKKYPELSHCVIEYNQLTDPEKPDLLDVVNGFMLDAQAGELSFDEFCSELGYDNDKISHKEIWEACCKIQRQVARAKWPMETLQELFQDY